MKSLHQIATVTVMNLKALPGRVALSLVIVIGMAMVVAVTLSLLSMSRGLIHMVEQTGDPNRVIVLARDAQGEGQSSLSRADTQTILDMAGIKPGADGKPVASADVVSSVAVTQKTDGLLSFLQVRGVTENFFALHPEIHLAAGRPFTPALHEVVVGRLVSEKFIGFALNDSVSLSDGDWKVVGIFDSDGLWGSTILTDAATLMGAYHRSGFNSVTARVDPGDAAYARFADAVKTNPSVNVEPQRETAYYAKAFEGNAGFLRLIAYWVGGVMAAGAVFGALNTMYSAVSTRTLEIATLRAIGFGASPVVVSIITESLLLAFAGAAIGAAGAWSLINGKVHVFGNFPIILTIDGPVFLAAVVIALIVGALGALFPAIRAARLPVATALQVR